jgi:DNA alkylation repair enzyme
MSHDEVTALSSELWAPAVFERRQAAIILLQANVDSLVAKDLTRIEGFIRSAGSDALVDELIADVVGPMLAKINVDALSPARTILKRWASDPDAGVRSAGRRLSPEG